MPILAKRSSLSRKSETMNLIDECWRRNPRWWSHRQQLASCSVGYSGKMTNNTGEDVIFYQVTDSGNNATNPNLGTLRYGVTHIRGKVWITFQKGMHIKLEIPLLVPSFTAVDGRGAKVQISGAGLWLNKVSNVIIHGLVIHHIGPQKPGLVMRPRKKISKLRRIDGDAIRLVSSSKVWIDHNTLYKSHDGLVDVTRGSTEITISNNWFKNHDKVMLLGHDDGFLRDKDMKVTVVFNHFSPGCKQRMPRVRHGYAHVVNNLYLGWGVYAIGGSLNPRVKSQANLFIAPNSENKEVTWRQNEGRGMNTHFRSVNDVFENGASFKETKGTGGGIKPNYTTEQYLEAADGTSVSSLTQFSGALKCRTTSKYC